MTGEILGGKLREGKLCFHFDAMSMSRLALVGAFVFGLVAATFAEPETTVWQGASGANWEDGNWSNGAPTADVVADFSGVAGALDVKVPNDVTVGGLKFGNGAVTLGGAGTITFSRSDAAAEIFVAEGGSTAISNNFAGAGTVVKTGAGYLSNYAWFFNNDGRVIVRGGTLSTLRGSIPEGRKHGPKNLTEWWIGQSPEGMLVEADGTFLMFSKNILNNDMPITVDGGLFDFNWQQEYVGKVTLKNGGVMKNGQITPYDGPTCHFAVEGTGGKLSYSTLYLTTKEGSYNSPSRVLNVDVADGATLVFDRVTLADQTTAAGVVYAGQLDKTGAGTLLFDGVNGTGSTADANGFKGVIRASEGVIVLTNVCRYAKATLRTEKDGGTVAFAPGADVSFAAVRTATTRGIDLGGGTLTLLGGADSVLFAPLTNGNFLVSGDARVSVAKNMEAFASTTVRKGSLELRPRPDIFPFVCWTFDNAAAPGEDTGDCGVTLHGTL